MAVDRPDHRESDQPIGAGGDHVGVSGSLPDEDELARAFERLSPQGSLTWALTDALRRLGEVPPGTATSAPWRGLPGDLWERGRAAKAGQRMMGDVVDSLAALMDANARQILEAGDRELQDRLTAAWDALRYLAARVDKLEARVDPLDELLVDVGDLVGSLDLSAWSGVAGAWFEDPDTDRPILVGESMGPMAEALRSCGHRVLQVEPQGARAWEAAGGLAAGEVLFADLATTLEAAGARTLSGAVLAGPVDFLDSPGKLVLLGKAVHAVAAGGTVVVLTTDQGMWDERLGPVARDLLAGRPLHPETWALLFRRLGLVDPTWNRPVSGSIHAVVGKVGR